VRSLQLLAGPGRQPGQELVRTRDWPLHSYLELQALPASVCSARRHARDILQQWHMGALSDAVELLVSEIVTNAVRASAGLTAADRRTGQAPQVRLWLTSDRRSVLIQVWDGDDHRAVRQDAGLDAEAGRGLLLVEALSTQWGCHRPDGQNGKIVWALCPRAGCPA
jgi:anti-sigma regulatory factor (Ser/Thr protein kinase)